MKITVYGLWHLGCVTAACLADMGHDVVGHDVDVESLRNGKSPISDPGLDDLIKKGLDSGQLVFNSYANASFHNSDIVWITFDTPVDNNDIADTQFVINKIKDCIPLLDDGTIVIVSSQLPVGTTRSIQKEIDRIRPNSRIAMVYSPENLRLGKSIDCFKNPDRFIMGMDDRSCSRITDMLFEDNVKIEYMSINSAEMVKHAINSFLALSIVFINELSNICESEGADISDVTRGLQSEKRIGKGLPLRAGRAFDGGTLARDVSFLKSIAEDNNLYYKFWEDIIESNNEHKRWTMTKIYKLFPILKNKKIGILGLAYKEGTDTLRRSQSIELCEWLISQGARVFALDPLVKNTGNKDIQLSLDTTSLNDCEIIVVNMKWDGLDKVMASYFKDKIVIDPSGYFKDIKFKQYYRIGFSQ